MKIIAKVVTTLMIGVVLFGLLGCDLLAGGKGDPIATITDLDGTWKGTDGDSDIYLTFDDRTMTGIMRTGDDGGKDLEYTVQPYRSGTLDAIDGLEVTIHSESKKSTITLAENKESFTGSEGDSTVTFRKVEKVPTHPLMGSWKTETTEPTTYYMFAQDSYSITKVLGGGDVTMTVDAEELSGKVTFVYKDKKVTVEEAGKANIDITLIDIGTDINATMRINSITYMDDATIPGSAILGNWKGPTKDLKIADKTIFTYHERWTFTTSEVTNNYVIVTTTDAKKYPLGINTTLSLIDTPVEYTVTSYMDTIPNSLTQVIAKVIKTGTTATPEDMIFNFVLFDKKKFLKETNGVAYTKE